MNTLNTFPVSGQVAPGFEPVRAAFEKNFTKFGEVGAALHVTINDKPVVDLWGGAADAAVTCPWTADTLVNVWSTTKGWLALAMHLLADHGLLDFDAPVARYWPEFAQHGKDKVLVRHILTHTSGLPAPSMKVPDAAVYEWETMVHALEQSELFWEPGTKCGYHAATFGWLNGEVLRRITGMSVGQFIRSQISEPLNAEAFIGLTEAEQARAADIVPPSRFGEWLFDTILGLRGREGALAFNNPPRPSTAANTCRWREAEIPSSNGHASARGLARMYEPLALGGKANQVNLLSEASVERACREQIFQQDIVIGMKQKRSLGFMLSSGPNDALPPTAVGHPGKGGSLGFADPAQRLAFGYVMNKMIIGLDTRAGNLSRAVYACLKH
jgi:CubicO group peptidase (beta-lactamase class C family)